MNKPKMMREGFVSSEDEPFERSEDLSPLERPAKTIDRQPEPVEQKAEQPLGKAVEWPFTYKLIYRPLKLSKDATVDELTFREPNAGDLLDYGNPVNIEFRQIGKQVAFDVHVDDNKMMFLLGNLCTDKRIMGDHLKGLDVRDFANISHRLRRFFRPDWESVSF